MRKRRRWLPTAVPEGSRPAVSRYSTLDGTVQCHCYRPLARLGHAHPCHCQAAPSYWLPSWRFRPRPGAGLPFVTDDPEPVDDGHWEIIGFATGTMTGGDSAGMLPGIEINHGALPNLQLHISASIAYNSQSVTGTEFGYGATTFRKMPLHRSQGWRVVAAGRHLPGDRCQRRQCGPRPAHRGDACVPAAMDPKGFWRVDDVRRRRVRDQSGPWQPQRLVLRL